MSVEVFRRRFLGSTLDVVSLQAAGAGPGEKVRARLRVQSAARSGLASSAMPPQAEAAPQPQSQPSTAAQPPQQPPQPRTTDPAASATSSAPVSSPAIAPAASSAKRAISDLRALLFDEDTRACLRTVVAVLDNARKWPNDPVKRCLRLSNPAVQRKIGAHPPAIHLLQAAGFRVVGTDADPEGRRLVLEVGASHGGAELDAARKEAADTLRELGAPVGPPPEPRQAPGPAGGSAARAAAQVPTVPFDPFKPQLTRLAPQATRDGVSKGTVQLQEGQAGGEPVPASSRAGAGAGSSSAGAGAGAGPSGASAGSGDLLAAVEQRAEKLRREREALVPASMEGMRGVQIVGRGSGKGAGAGAGAGGSMRLAAAGSAAYLTERAARAALKARRAGSSSSVLATLKRKRMQRERASQLRLRADREMEQLATGPVFRWAVVSVLLPGAGGKEVEGRFSPRETVGQIRAMVSQCLHPAAQGATFELFTAIPRRSYGDSETVLEAGLLPAAKLRIRFPGGAPSLPEGEGLVRDTIPGAGGVETDPNAGVVPLDADVGRLPGGGFVIIGAAEDGGRGEGSRAGEDAGEVAAASGAARGGASAGGGSLRVPKWLKPG